MPKWWNNMGCSAQFLVGIFAFSVIYLTVLKSLSLFGYEPFEGSGRLMPAEPFSRKACIQRHQDYYFERNPDMTELDETKISIIARRCAVEESEYYGR